MHIWRRGCHPWAIRSSCKEILTKLVCLQCQKQPLCPHPTSQKPAGMSGMFEAMHAAVLAYGRGHAGDHARHMQLQQQQQSQGMALWILNPGFSLLIMDRPVFHVMQRKTGQRVLSRPSCPQQTRLRVAIHRHNDGNEHFPDERLPGCLFVMLFVKDSKCKQKTSNHDLMGFFPITHNFSGSSGFFNNV